MSGEVLTQRVTILNRQGLHARPADLFVRAALRFGAKIEVVKDGNRVNGKSILEILTLCAEHGSELLIEACGPDADVALLTLVELIENKFGNGEDEQQEQAANQENENQHEQNQD